jgi:hypothetical protein
MRPLEIQFQGVGGRWSKDTAIIGNGRVSRQCGNSTEGVEGRVLRVIEDQHPAGTVMTHNAGTHCMTPAGK